jgi:hypothetical protein
LVSILIFPIGVLLRKAWLTFHLFLWMLHRWEGKYLWVLSCWDTESPKKVQVSHC